MFLVECRCSLLVALLLCCICFLVADSWNRISFKYSRKDQAPKEAYSLPQPLLRIQAAKGGTYITLHFAPILRFRVASKLKATNKVAKRTMNFFNQIN